MLFIVKGGENNSLFMWLFMGSAIELAFRTIKETLQRLSDKSYSPMHPLLSLF